jgi:hypothetical protein
MTPQETLKRLQAWIRSVGVPDCETVEPPSEAEADAAIRAVLEENERLELRSNASQYAESMARRREENECLRALSDRWMNEAGLRKARIEVALALHVVDPDDEDYCLCGWYLAGGKPCPTVKALQGENSEVTP